MATLPWKSYLRRARGSPALGRALRAPIERLVSLGVRVPARVYQHLPFTGPFTVPVPGGGHFVIEAHGHVIENRLRWAGWAGHEPESSRPWVEFARASRVALDVGANTGHFSLLAAAVSPGCHVHAFEPVARICALLRRNCELNPGFAITAHEAAVGAEEGALDLYDPGGELSYSASLNPAFLPGAARRVYPVRVVTIDGFVAERALERVDLVKLDVEGYEPAALAGMRETLRRFRPALFVELLRGSGAELIDALEGLRAQGFDFYHLTGEGLRPCDRVRPSDDGVFNVLLCPPERLPPGVRVLGRP